MKYIGKTEESNRSSIIQYALPVVIIALTLLLVQGIPSPRGNSSILALAILFAVILSHFALKYYEKLLMKRNAENFKLLE